MHASPAASGLYDPRYEHDSCGIGLVAQIHGVASHQILLDADEMLCRMDHRGACGAESNTGDGAGILTALPQAFFADVVATEFPGVNLSHGRFGVGNFFLPTRRLDRDACLEILAQTVREQGQSWVGWRPLPVDFDGANLGTTSRLAAPYLAQVFIEAGDSLSADDFERRLYAIRKIATSKVRRGTTPETQREFYCCSLSSRVIVFKGMLTSWQLRRFFSDLRQPDFRTHLCMVHSRFSTNTFPSWSRAQPLRWICHNGEINTLRGNVNWMQARQGIMQSPMFGDSFSDLLPVIEPDVSDSGAFDNALELLIMNGRSLAESMAMMIPEAWQKQTCMPASKRDFYEYHSCLMEPWDGPAAIVFTDGRVLGAILDRNGLRPARYYTTKDDRVILASEVGVVSVPPEEICEKGRLRSGWMLLIDFEQGRIVPDEELKQQFARQRPYHDWLKKHRIRLDELPVGEDPHGYYPETLLPRMRAQGYSVETGQFQLFPLVLERRDPLGSMGNDAALACLSDQPRLLYDYFRQLFAQVTNPPIDSIREEVVMSLECYIGPEGNLLDPGEDACARLFVPHPILTNEETAAIKGLNYRGWTSRTIDITFARSEGPAGLTQALDRVCQEADSAISEGVQLIVLSDRALGRDRVPIGTLLACGAVHHHLVRTARRTRVGLVMESGDAREVHHHCLLIGYGADAINPYLAFESLWRARRQGVLNDPALTDDEAVVAAYRHGVAKGIMKVMAKMGISTLQSYKGAQIFEAVGLHARVIDRCFAGTVSRLQGLDFPDLAEEALRRHERGYPERRTVRNDSLPNWGDYHWRPDGELHAWDPTSIAELQRAARGNSREAYRRFAEHLWRSDRRRCTIRGLLDFKTVSPEQMVPVEEVEPASCIVRRFSTGAMSFGSISAEAHETLAVAMNRIGGKSNTGEGGEAHERFIPLPNGDSKRSAIKQVASGRFGVTIHYLTNADELQIKIAQGAKPGEGGELPGRKVDPQIARIRFSTPGVGLISPPPHHDIYSIEDLKQLIYDLKNANPRARISVKLVSEVGVGTIAAGVTKGFADHIVIAGDSGGTGASPWTSIKHAGLPWELGLAEAHQTLLLNDLRHRVVLQTDGGLKTGRDVVIAAMLGAEEMGFATAPLVALGCIMMRKCHLNTCPVGIATQDPELRAKFAGQPEHLINYLFLVAEEVREILASLGLRRFKELIGRVDLLEISPLARQGKARTLDLSPLLKSTISRSGMPPFCTEKQNHPLHWALDHRLIDLAQPALESGQPVRAALPIYNRNRTVGTMLSHEIARRYGEAGLPNDTLRFHFTGTAGQSFGAFLAQGITLILEGDANDYVGKGLSGGQIVIYPPRGMMALAEENIIVGNVALYGAIRGEVYLRGQAAERFCVRNSGATVVVEGVGDHACEYMTGGRAIILGPTGSNFGAGMSGGIAYVWDPEHRFAEKCNTKTIDLETVSEAMEREELLAWIERHRKYTGSVRAAQILSLGANALNSFVKVMPKDLKRVLSQQQKKERIVQGRPADGL